MCWWQREFLSMFCQIWYLIWTRFTREPINMFTCGFLERILLWMVHDVSKFIFIWSIWFPFIHKLMYYMLFMTSAWILEPLVNKLTCSGCYSSILCEMHALEKFHLLLFNIARNTKVIEINTCSLLVFLDTKAQLFNQSQPALNLCVPRYFIVWGLTPSEVIPISRYQSILPLLFCT